MAKRTLDEKLYMAVILGNVPWASRLIEEGADVNFVDSHRYHYGLIEMTPLMIAIDRRNEILARLLMEKGANVLAESRFGSYPLALAFSRFGTGSTFCRSLMIAVHHALPRW